jgi:hypothetical protein
MDDRTFVANAPATDDIVPTLKFALFGAAAGLLIGICSAFALILSASLDLGLSTAGRFGFASLMTLFLSQPAGLAGMAVGIVVGAMVGVVTYHYRRARASRWSASAARARRQRGQLVIAGWRG